MVKTVFARSRIACHSPAVGAIFSTGVTISGQQQPGEGQTCSTLDSQLSVYRIQQVSLPEIQEHKMGWWLIWTALLPAKLGYSIPCVPPECDIASDSLSVPGMECTLVPVIVWIIWSHKISIPGTFLQTQLSNWCNFFFLHFLIMLRLTIQKSIKPITNKSSTISSL